MDFRKFLQRPSTSAGETGARTESAATTTRSPAGRDADELVLPYFGGPYVNTRDRRLRLRVGEGSQARERSSLRPGFYRFAIVGQGAKLLGPAEPPPLDDLKAVRGHILGERLVLPSGEVEPLFFLPEEVPPRCSPIVARRWPTGELLFGELEFESDPEETARRALQDGRTLASVTAVPASLRAAFAYTVGERAAQRLHVAVSPLELLPYVKDIAERGIGAAEAALSKLEDERRAYANLLAQQQRERLSEAAAQAAARQREQNTPQPHYQPAPHRRDSAAANRSETLRNVGRERHERSVEERIETALYAAGATLLDSRALVRNQVEVTYRFRGQRFLSIVDATTLQVIDAGVCLAGADSMVTLESLPSVIKEAIDTHRLVITRRAPGDQLDDYDDY